MISCTLYCISQLGRGIMKSYTPLRSRGTPSSSRQTTIKRVHSVCKTQSSSNKGTLQHTVFTQCLAILPFGCAWINPLSPPSVYTRVLSTVFQGLAVTPLFCCSAVSYLRPSSLHSLFMVLFLPLGSSSLISLSKRHSSFSSASESQVKELSTEPRLSGYGACGGSRVNPR